MDCQCQSSPVLPPAPRRASVSNYLQLANEWNHFMYITAGASKMQKLGGLLPIHGDWLQQMHIRIILAGLPRLSSSRGCWSSCLAHVIHTKFLALPARSSPVKGCVIVTHALLVSWQKAHPSACSCCLHGIVLCSQCSVCCADGLAKAGLSKCGLLHQGVPSSGRAGAAYSGSALPAPLQQHERR